MHYYNFTSDPTYAYDSVEIIHDGHTWNFRVEWDIEQYIDDAGKYIVAAPEVYTIDLYTDGRPSNYDRFKQSTGLNHFDVFDALDSFLSELQSSFGTIHPADIPSAFTSDYLSAIRKA